CTHGGLLLEISSAIGPSACNQPSIFDGLNIRKSTWIWFVAVLSSFLPDGNKQFPFVPRQQSVQMDPPFITKWNLPFLPSQKPCCLIKSYDRGSSAAQASGPSY